MPVEPEDPQDTITNPHFVVGYAFGFLTWPAIGLGMWIVSKLEAFRHSLPI